MDTPRLDPKHESMITILAETAQEIYDEHREGGLDHDGSAIEGAFETIDQHREMLTELTLVEEIAFMDDLTRRYKIADVYETEQVEAAMYGDDWRDIIHALFYEIVRAAVAAENGWESLSDIYT